MTAPIDGQVLLLVGAKASVGPGRVNELVERVHDHLRPRADEYAKRYEQVLAADGARYYLADADHWEQVGDELGFGEREVDAVRRAHSQQLLWAGRRADREDEFEAALDIRDAVVVGTD
jgi:hypothetical protein